MSRRWIGVLGVGTAIVCLAVVWSVGGLSSADQVASVIGAVAGVTAVVMTIPSAGDSGRPAVVNRVCSFFSKGIQVGGTGDQNNDF